MGTHSVTVGFHPEKPENVEVRFDAYEPNGHPQDGWLNIYTDQGYMTIHNIDMVTFKNSVLWAYQEWERRRNKS